MPDLKLFVTKSKPSPIAISSCDGVDKLFIKINHCGIHPMVLAVDGVRVTTFDRRKNTPYYIRLEDAIHWYTDELKRFGAARTPGQVEYMQSNLEELRNCQDAFERGAIYDSEDSLASKADAPALLA